MERVGSVLVPTKSQSLQKRLLHREQGVPLKGPFLGHFSQGNFAKVNENVHFGVFRIFCVLSLLRLGILTLLRVAFEACFAWQF